MWMTGMCTRNSAGQNIPVNLEAICKMRNPNLIRTSASVTFFLARHDAAANTDGYENSGYAAEQLP